MSTTTSASAAGTAPEGFIIKGVSPYGRPLAVGEPAIFTLVDPRADWTVTEAQRYSKSSNNPFLGSVFRYRIVSAVLNGIPIHGHHLINHSNG